ncbi:hypothetical protein ACOME3_001503 [Neoechinorhynchus agilis]
MKNQHLPLYISGIVEPGFKRGSRELGFPTDDECVQGLPNSFEDGVYYGYARVERGNIYPMVMSVGYNPQFKNRVKSLEVHILHVFSNDFYGHRLRVLVCGYIRPMRIFASTQELIKAIELDICCAMKELRKKDIQFQLFPDFALQKS